nr:MAG TPA: hypothetical protein [Caudoviricetes sp.]
MCYVQFGIYSILAQQQTTAPAATGTVVEIGIA